MKMVNPWLDAIIAAIFAVAGAVFGHLFSRLPKPYWLFGYFIPFTFIVANGLAVHHLASFLPISWMMAGREKFALLGFVITMVLTTPLSRLPRARDRRVVVIMMAVAASAISVWPPLAPAFSRSELEQLKTRIGPDGVCLQSTGYTCGPAAAVTALRKLGFPAEEGKIAILSRTSSATGTEPDILAAALQNEYGKDGLIAEYRTFKDISELRRAGLALAVIKFSFMVDHYVTVLEVTDSDVVIGDPLNGLDRLSYDEFQQRWRYTGVVLKRVRRP